MNNTEKNIGEASSMLTSSASRAMNLKPDNEQIKQYDEYTTGLNIFGITTLLLALGAAFWSFTLFRAGHWAWGSLLALATIFLAMLTNSFLKAMLKKSVAYENGLIVSAIVINTNPIQILALADIRASEDLPPLFGCQKMTVKSLPRHRVEMHEKIPCVSMFGGSSKGYWQHFEPRPICWGYKDAKAIEHAIKVIDVEHEDLPRPTEWDMLYELEAQMKEVADKEVVTFDTELKKV